MPKTKAARNSCSYSTPKTSTRTDKQIITDYELGTRYASWLMFGMFAFMAAWMWFTW